MPGGDRTGPRGLGSMTGRGLGYSRGFGYGRGWGYRSPVYAPVYAPYPTGIIPTITPENQLSMLKQEKEYLESEMNGIKSAMADISKKIEELEKK